MLFVMGFGSYKYTPPGSASSAGDLAQMRRQTPLFLFCSLCWLIYGAFAASGTALRGASRFPEGVGLRGGPVQGVEVGEGVWGPSTHCGHLSFLGPGSCEAPSGTQSDPPHAGTMFRKKKKKRPEISAPQNFQHRVHTSFDPKEGKFVGLPPQWQNILDTLRRPKPVVDPSRITRVQLQPMKVRRASGMAEGEDSDHPPSQRAAGKTTQAPEEPPDLSAIS